MWERIPAASHLLSCVLFLHMSSMSLPRSLDLASDPKSSVSYNGISLLKATHEYVAPCQCVFLLSFLMMKTHHLSRSKHTRHFSKCVTTLSSNSNLILMITLCGMYHDDLHFTHQETEALRGYINFPTMKWQGQDSNTALSDSKAPAPNCSALLAKLNLAVWPNTAGHSTSLTFVLLWNRDNHRSIRLHELKIIKGKNLVWYQATSSSKFHENSSL